MTPGGQDTTSRLTAREVDVLRMVFAGLSSKHIGARLGIAPRTVDAYVEHARMKLGASNRSHMIFRAISEGLLDIAVQDPAAD